MIKARVNDPEDIIGTVLVMKGVVIEGTLEMMPTHRLISSAGLFQLNEFMHNRLLEDIMKEINQ